MAEKCKKQKPTFVPPHGSNVREWSSIYKFTSGYPFWHVTPIIVFCNTKKDILSIVVSEPFFSVAEDNYWSYVPKGVARCELINRTPFPHI
jgi:hypothetical protein